MRRMMMVAGALLAGCTTAPAAPQRSAPQVAADSERAQSPQLSRAMSDAAFALAMNRAIAVGTWLIATECGIRRADSLPGARRYMEDQMSADIPAFAASLGVTTGIAWATWSGMVVMAETLAEAEVRNYPDAACARVRRLLPPRGTPT